MKFRLLIRSALVGICCAAASAFAGDWYPISCTVTYTASWMGNVSAHASAQSTGTKSMSYGGSVTDQAWLNCDAYGVLTGTSHSYGNWVVQATVTWEIGWQGIGPEPSTAGGVADINENQFTMFKLVDVVSGMHSSGWAKGIGGGGLTTGSVLYYTWATSGFMPPINNPGTGSIPLAFSNATGHMIATLKFGVQQGTEENADDDGTPNTWGLGQANMNMSGSITLDTVNGQPI